jgi:nitrate reductase NapAB chaperone NapD
MTNLKILTDYIYSLKHSLLTELEDRKQTIYTDDEEGKLVQRVDARITSRIKQQIEELDNILTLLLG